jgi:hypothetical protein
LEALQDSCNVGDGMQIQQIASQQQTIYTLSSPGDDDRFGIHVLDRYSLIGSHQFVPACQLACCFSVLALQVLPHLVISS